MNISAISTSPRQVERFSFAFTVALASLTAFGYGFGRHAYGLFIPSLRAEFHLTTFQLGLIGSLNAGVYLIATILASVSAVYFRPRTFLLASAVVTSAGLGMAALASNQWVAAAGILLAGAGPGILTPAMFEAIEAWLVHPWKNRAIAAINAAPTVGLIFTGLVAVLMVSEWRHAWLTMAAIGVVVIACNAVFLPPRELAPKGSGVKLKLEWSLFTRTECVPLYLTIITYGLVMSVYLTFAVDLVVSAGGMDYPLDRLFWVLLGVAGFPTMFVGGAISRWGVRVLLSVAIPGCGVGMLMLALGSGSALMAFGSAIVFGLASWAPGAAISVWAIGLFRDRPSLASGLFFFTLYAAFIAGPTVYGLLVEHIEPKVVLTGIACLTFVVVPLFPRGVFDTSKA